MLFCCFNPIPWPNVPERPSAWPYPNRHFDPDWAHTYYRSQIEQLRFAEECGFDWVGLGEDHMTAYSLTPNPALIVSIVGYLTQRVKLAIMGLPLPLLNPIRAAEECAMLDVLTGGRLIVGFIRGVPQNYAAYNVEPNESRERFEEASQIIVRAWTEADTFSWCGKYYQFPTISLWPRPIQTPHPPLIYSANSKESGVIGAKNRAMIGTIHLYNRNAVSMVQEVIAAYKQQARSDGWEPSPDRFLIGLQTCIADSDAEARRLLKPALYYHYNILSGTFNAQKREIARTKPGYGITPVEEKPLTLEERLQNHLILCGAPDTVAGQIEYLRQTLGVGVISMQFQVGNLDDATVRKGMALFHSKVLPRFR
jgi:alkanesulfonate monooxygenase SsuD/methylene tetrahydromethanopterin reductase-like flavin-dependent oxidoreductase (luciferase family)